MLVRVQAEPSVLNFHIFTPIYLFYPDLFKIYSKLILLAYRYRFGIIYTYLLQIQTRWRGYA
jgi:hypothetical protein